jgi:two-component system sensor histidine kinase DegS
MSNDASPATTVAELTQQLQKAQNDLKELELMMRQSRGETSTLGRRDSQISNRIHQIEANAENFSREEIREAYKVFNESQMRLFMMRSQGEQLETKRSMLEQHIQLLQQMIDLQRIAELTSGLGAPAPTESAAVPVAPAPTAQQTIIRIIDAQERERQMLSRQLHDGPASSLSNLVLQAEVVERLFEMDQAQARAEIGVLKTQIQTTFQRIRDYIFNLRPMMLDDLGLLPTLRRFVQEYETKTKIPSQLTIMGKDRRLPSHIEVIVFRAVQELLTNIQRHANASHVQINLDLGDEAVSVVVEDDGSGFEVEKVLDNARAKKTLGISNMLERIEMLGGQLHFDSTVGRGTRAQLHLPTG